MRPGGRLFVYDLAREGDDNRLAEARVHARLYPVARLADLAAAEEWTLDGIAHPAGRDDVLGGLVSDPAEYRAIFGPLRATVWRFTRERWARAKGSIVLHRPGAHRHCLVD